MKNGKDKNNKGKLASGKGKPEKLVKGKGKDIVPNPIVGNGVVPKPVFGKGKKALPNKFPFWARLHISKRRTTLVIDETKELNKNTNKLDDCFVHREATHTYKSEFEKLEPNPDKTDKRPMYLRRPRVLPKNMFAPHNKKLQMPKHLQDKYSPNNDKNKEK